MKQLRIDFSQDSPKDLGESSHPLILNSHLKIVYHNQFKCFYLKFDL